MCLGFWYPVCKKRTAFLEWRSEPWRCRSCLRAPAPPPTFYPLTPPRLPLGLPLPPAAGCGQDPPWRPTHTGRFVTCPSAQCLRVLRAAGPRGRGGGGGGEGRGALCSLPRPLLARPGLGLLLAAANLCETRFWRASPGFSFGVQA
jgi:hypothetical protein